MPALVKRANGNVVVTVRLTLVPGRDDRLLALILSAPRRGLAGTIRAAMHSGVESVDAIPCLMADAAAEVDISGLGDDL
ncbi:MAG TPA: hypothetical protein VJG32_03030 [Anaerolineae bacterium]|nr:hypothetical protein [Anaerolineae bacterium]